MLNNKVLTRGETLRIPGIDASSLEFIRGGKKITMASGAVLYFETDIGFFVLEGTEKQINTTLGKAKATS